MSWPQVMSEARTIDFARHGWSLSRFGDGELKVMAGKGYAREPVNPALSEELLDVFQNPAWHCLTCIPTMDPNGPKYENWTRHKARFEALLPEMEFWGSAFVTRPDSAPWIESRAYAESVQALWQGKRVAVVCERKGSIYRTVKLASGSTIHVECPTHRAYAQIDRLQAQVEDFAPDVAVLSAGVTATVLANRLAGRGIQALDLGSAGKFLYRNLV